MNKRVNPQLWETSSNNLVADVGFTLTEVKELVKVLYPAIAASHKETSADSGRKTEVLSHALTSLLETNKLLKSAEQARSQGRYKANVSPLNNTEGKLMK